MSHSPNLQSVAARAGVSAMTVSRVINRHPRVSEATALKVQEAIDALGYSPTPSLHRRGRPSRASQGIHTGLVAMVMAEETMHNPVMESTIHGMEAYLQTHDIDLIKLSIDEGGRLPDIINRRSIDGIITSGLHPDLPLAGEMLSMPRVMVYGSLQRPRNPKVDEVSPDNQRVAQLAASALLERGFTHCAYFDPSPGHPEFEVRGQGFIDTMEKAGGRVEVYHREGGSNSHEVDIDRQALEALVHRFLNTHPRPKGIFLPSDQVTAVFHRLLRLRHVDPSEFVMVSCNRERPYLEGLYPAPISIDIHPEEVGQRAAGLLLERLHQPDPKARIHLVKPELVQPSR